MGEESELTFRWECVKVLEGHSFTVWALVVSSDGKFLFSASSDGNVIVSATQSDS